MKTHLCFWNYTMNTFEVACRGEASFHQKGIYLGSPFPDEVTCNNCSRTHRYKKTPPKKEWNTLLYDMSYLIPYKYSSVLGNLHEGWDDPGCTNTHMRPIDPANKTERIPS